MVNAEFWAHSVYAQFMKHPVTCLAVSCVPYSCQSITKKVAFRYSCMLKNFIVELLSFYRHFFVSFTIIPVVWCDEKWTPRVKINRNLNFGMRIEKVTHCNSLRLWESRGATKVFPTVLARRTRWIVGELVCIVAVKVDTLSFGGATVCHLRVNVSVLSNVLKLSSFPVLLVYVSHTINIHHWNKHDRPVFHQCLVFLVTMLISM